MYFRYFLKMRDQLAADGKARCDRRMIESVDVEFTVLHHDWNMRSPVLVDVGPDASLYIYVGRCLCISESAYL